MSWNSFCWHCPLLLVSIGSSCTFIYYSTTSFIIPNNTSSHGRFIIFFHVSEFWHLAQSSWDRWCSLGCRLFVVASLLTRQVDAPDLGHGELRLYLPPQLTCWSWGLHISDPRCRLCASLRCSWYLQILASRCAFQCCWPVCKCAR